MWIRIRASTLFEFKWKDIRWGLHPIWFLFGKMMWRGSGRGCHLLGVLLLLVIWWLKALGLLDSKSINRPPCHKVLFIKKFRVSPLLSMTSLSLLYSLSSSPTPKGVGLVHLVRSKSWVRCQGRRRLQSRIDWDPIRDLIEDWSRSLLIHHGEGGSKLEKAS